MNFYHFLIKLAMSALLVENFFLSLLVILRWS